MNRKRGLSRIWLLGSSLWIAGWLVFVWQSCVPQAGASPISLGLMFCRVSLFDDWMMQPRYFGFTEYGYIVGTALSLPVLCLVLGCIVWWIASEFLS
jgi:hypothetical protein